MLNSFVFLTENCIKNMICVEFEKLLWTGCSPWTSWAALDTLNFFSTSTLKRMHKDLRDVTDLQHIWSQDWNSSSICYFPQSNQIGSICYIYVWDFKIPKVYLDPPPPSPPIQVTPCPSPLGNIGLKHQTHIDTL